VTGKKLFDHRIILLSPTFLVDKAFFLPSSPLINVHKKYEGSLAHRNFILNLKGF
jgi:hypothetical protein